MQTVAGGMATNLLNQGVDVSVEYDAAWAGQAVYVHSPAWDDPLVRLTGGPAATARYYHEDGLGSVVALTDKDDGTPGGPVSMTGATATNTVQGNPQMLRDGNWTGLTTMSGCMGIPPYIPGQTPQTPYPLNSPCTWVGISSNPAANPATFTLELGSIEIPRRCAQECGARRRERGRGNQKAGTQGTS